MVVPSQREVVRQHCVWIMVVFQIGFVWIETLR